MNLSELLRSLIAGHTLSFFLKQWAFIVLLSVFGYLLLRLVRGTKDGILACFLCLPAGLAVLMLTGYLLLVCGVPYRVETLFLSFGAVFVLLAVISLLAVQRAAIWNRSDFKALGLILALWSALAILAVSGLLTVSLSNDSMYFFRFYPRCIVAYGGLREGFDVYLTNVGLGRAVIGTFPLLLGFDETFGLQHALNFSLLGAFGVGVHRLTSPLAKRTRLTVCVLSVLLLLSSLPFLIISKWALSNSYFMVYMFWAAGYAYERRANHTAGDLAVLALLCAALSTLRVEGGVFILMFALCLTVLPYRGSKVALWLVLPAMLLQAGYLYRTVFSMRISSPYLFMTPGKAVLLLGMMCAEFLYLIFLRGRWFLRWQKYYGLLIVLGLAGVNALLFLLQPADYLVVFRAFVKNLLYVGGWSIFPVMIVGIYLVSLNREFRFGYFDVLSASYLLYVVAVGFMRGGGLAVNVGDSGNRVLLQLTPILLFAALTHLVQKMGRDGNE